MLSNSDVRLSKRSDDNLFSLKCDDLVRLNNQLKEEIARLKALTGYIGTVCNQQVNSRPMRIVKTNTVTTEHYFDLEMIKEYWRSQFLNIEGKYIAFFLNAYSKIIGFRILHESILVRDGIEVQSITQYAVSLKAQKVVIVQKNSTDKIRPTSNDADVSINLSLYLSLFGIKVEDHYIFSGDLNKVFVFSGDDIWGKCLRVTY